jgi:hypothetical protein
MLPVWVIYDHPRDYPNHFVVRRQWSDRGMVHCDRNCYLTRSLAEARAVIDRLAPGLVCFQRSSEDDPFIVESWL